MSGQEPSEDQEDLKQTALDVLHREFGAKMVPFAGDAMPVQYQGGIIAAHLHTRENASVFDVSHMGQARLKGGEAAAMALRWKAPSPWDMLRASLRIKEQRLT